MPRHVPDNFFGHPRPLSTLFHIELWERFSYYGMQSILLIYLYYEVTRGGLGIDQGLAGGIVGIYGGSVYLATILGGWLADRVLGAERTLFYSGIVVMLGHIALALLPGIPGLVVGLVCIALGSGGVKSSASAMVGALYENPQWHALRDAGFSIFYLAVNIGGFFGPLLTGVLQSEMGFHYGFGAAALGMAFGLWRYARGRAGLPQLPVPNPLSPAQRRHMLVGAVVVGPVCFRGHPHGQFLVGGAGHQHRGRAGLLRAHAAGHRFLGQREAPRAGLRTALSGSLRVLDAVVPGVHVGGGVL